MPKINDSKQATEPSKEVPFKKRYFAAGMLGRVVGAQLRKQVKKDKPSRLVRIADHAIKGLSDNLPPLSETTKANVKEIFSATTAWHGTGRFQYRDGKLVDVLSNIIQHGSIQPHPDALDLTGKMDSISTAPSRMYARAYADMHGKGSAEPNRHGSSMFWAWVFLGDIGIEAAIEGKVWTRAGRQATRDHFVDGGAVGWHQKVNGGYMGTMALFRRGSDIPGNYPVIFGIREDAFEPANTSRSVAIHEARSLKALSLVDDITHIEVPSEQILNVQEMLAQSGYETPVLAIEDCERYFATMPFSEHMRNNLLQHRE